MSIRARSFGEYWARLTACFAVAILGFLAWQLAVNGGRLGGVEVAAVAGGLALYFAILTLAWRRFEGKARRKGSPDRGVPLGDLGDLRDPPPETLARALDPYGRLRNPPSD